MSNVVAKLKTRSFCEGEANMYKNFRKFLKKVLATDINMSQKVEIKGFNWSLANGQFWSRDKNTMWADKVELIHDYKGAVPGCHNNAMYQAIIGVNGKIDINGEGLNKRMDTLLKAKMGEIINHIRYCEEKRQEVSIR